MFSNRFSLAWLRSQLPGEQIPVGFSAAQNLERLEHLTRYGKRAVLCYALGEQLGTLQHPCPFILDEGPAALAELRRNPSPRLQSAPSYQAAECTDLRVLLQKAQQYRLFHWKNAWSLSWLEDQLVGAAATTLRSAQELAEKHNRRHFADCTESLARLEARPAKLFSAFLIAHCFSAILNEEFSGAARQTISFALESSLDAVMRGLTSPAVENIGPNQALLFCNEAAEWKLPSGVAANLRGIAVVLQSILRRNDLLLFEPPRYTPGRGSVRGSSSRMIRRGRATTEED
ncbi:MAG TPA: hypothetical protein PLP17_08500 [Oligoflexia bacterium]|nr:hypothetical protein [Oligoflexia bacterium]